MHFGEDFLKFAMLVNGLFEPVGLGFGENETDGFILYLTGPNKAGAGLAGWAAVDRALAHIANRGELLAQLEVALFQRGEANGSHP